MEREINFRSHQKIKKLKYIYSILILLIFGCFSDSKAIKFSIRYSNGDKTEVSNSIDKKELQLHLDSMANLDFQKLCLTQSNQDNLIVEAKDKNGYLIIIKVRHEQFLIVEQPKTLDEVSKIMFEYLDKKDGIMNNYKFY